ncbi:PRC-barrel domain-containing protein [Prosthecobacter sp.]|uniref:PRC-barrel domain-containing protein n=1 Tax=Prosthecobacter sp. TaxID=1965333 RepID=UPI0024891DD9|nr:PRC-barrel domain-containing protein [Prosthecobacter sp.]MDI1310878.1 PRC-barrel domain-containing protein [Prosthecobacter sp.]
MKQELEHLYGLKLSAIDDEIGKVKDFYFDDQNWQIRYLVADTGGWLSGRQVLLSPDVFGTAALDDASGDAAHLRVNLTRQQIEDSPAIETHRTVTRQYEEQYYSYYGWPNYWDGGMLGAAGFPAFTPEPLQEDHSHHGHNQRDDIHLRSTQAITGYRVESADGEMGKVHGFVVDGKTWAISEVIIEPGQWRETPLLRVQAQRVARIDYESSTVFLDVPKSKVTQAVGNELLLTTHP